MKAVNSSCEEVRVGETGCDWRAETKKFLERFKEIFESVWLALVEALHDSLAESCRGKKVLLHFGRLFLQPDEDGIESSDRPVLVSQQTNVEL